MEIFGGRCLIGRTRTVAWTALTTAVVALALGASFPTSAERASDPQATIAALETKVAEQATTIAALQPSPTPKPKKTAVPTPASKPVDLGGGVFLYSYLLTDTDYGPYLAVDLVNSSGSPMLAPNLTASYVDADGASLGDDSLTTFLEWVDTKSHIPYITSSVLDGAYDLSEIADVTFSISPDTYTDYAEVDASNLKFTGVPLEGPDKGVSGRVKNTGDTAVKDITIVYAVYDANGNIVGSCYDYLGVSIPPGKSAKFSVSGDCGFVYAVEDHSTGGKPFSYRLMLSL